MKENANDKPYAIAQFSALYWEDLALQQPYGYMWFLTTQRGNIPLVSERSIKSGLASLYLPRGFSNNIRELGVYVTDGQGSGYYRTKPMINTASLFPLSSVCPSGLDFGCQETLANGYMLLLQRVNLS